MDDLNNKQIILDYLEAFCTLQITEEKYERFISDRNLALRRHVEVLQADLAVE